MAFQLYFFSLSLFLSFSLSPCTHNKKNTGRPEEEKERFVDRLSCFLVDNRRGKRIAIRLLLPDGSVHVCFPFLFVVGRIFCDFFGIFCDFLEFFVIFWDFFWIIILLFFFPFSFYLLLKV